MDSKLKVLIAGNLEKPVIADDQQDEFDRKQRDKLGTMVICMNAGILLMALIPNPLWGRVIFVDHIRHWLFVEAECSTKNYTRLM